ncbi:hypothetical protein TKK_0003859 [Trichogramma kaykai]|uniref:SHSP domain-containing protein n=1 Tax=Trichogramma kaykai TaxID=54128 RepID=A0ABD2XP81_9HYME
MRSRMTLIPKLVSQMWEQMERPHRLLDQHFGRDFFQPESFFNSSLFEMPRRVPYAYYRPMLELMKEAEEQSSGYSIIKNDKDKFHVALDVKQFKPEEINVKVIDNYIVVEGKHEEKHDDHGTISRHFVRKYMVPEQCDPEKASSTLDSEGLLTITAPRKPEAIENKKERVLKIEKVSTKPQQQQVEGKKEEPQQQQAQAENKQKMAQSQ